MIDGWEKMGVVIRCPSFDLWTGMEKDQVGEQVTVVDRERCGVGYGGRCRFEVGKWLR